MKSECPFIGKSRTSKLPILFDIGSLNIKWFKIELSQWQNIIYYTQYPRTFSDAQSNREAMEIEKNDILTSLNGTLLILSFRSCSILLGVPFQNSISIVYRESLVQLGWTSLVSLLPPFATLWGTPLAGLYWLGFSFNNLSLLQIMPIVADTNYKRTRTQIWSLLTE